MVDETSHDTGSAARDSPRTRRMPGPAVLAMYALLAAVGVLSVLSVQPPAARSASVPTTEFSADRALTALGGIASVPHPTGSPEQSGVRDHLAARLRASGLVPQELTRPVARTAPGRFTSAGTVTDVYATIAGTQPTGRVLIVAHYDSVPTGPGASDDGVNVAAILEIARILRAGPQPRNDVGVLFTEGEEQGLLGAQAFVDSGVGGDPARIVVLNLEARGRSGPAVMFQTAGAGLVPAVRASGAVTTSLADAIYRALPNDTDLTAFAAGGMRGLNFAFLDGASVYHTEQDDIAHVSPGSVQDMGDGVLGAARHLAGADLTADLTAGVTADRAAGSGGTFFSLAGTVVSYPGALTLPLAAVAMFGFVALLVWGGRRGLSRRGVATAGAAFPLCLFGAVAVGAGGWWLLARLRPTFDLTGGAVARLWPYILAEAGLLLVVLLGWYRLARRRGSALDVAVAVLGWFSVSALACALLLPGGAYLFIWPALVGTVAIAVVLGRTRVGSPCRVVAGCATAVPAVALILPVILLLVPTLGLALAAVPLLLGALVAATLAGAVPARPPARPLTAAMLVVAVVSAAAFGISAAVDGYDATRPRPVSLGYVLEADDAVATWVSVLGPDQPISGPLVTAGPVRLDARVPALRGGPLQSGPAPIAPGLGVPAVEPLPEQIPVGGVREVRARVMAPVGAYAVRVYADTTGHTVLGADVDGTELGPGPNLPAAAESAGWRWGFSWAAPPSDGLDLRIRVTGEGPLRLRVVAVTAGLPAGAPVLPPDASWAGWPSPAGQSFVTRTSSL